MNKLTPARIAATGRGLTGKAVYSNGLALGLIWLDCRVIGLSSVRIWFVHCTVDS